MDDAPIRVFLGVLIRREPAVQIRTYDDLIALDHGEEVPHSAPAKGHDAQVRRSERPSVKLERVVGHEVEDTSASDGSNAYSHSFSSSSPRLNALSGRTDRSAVLLVH